MTRQAHSAVLAIDIEFTLAQTKLQLCRYWTLLHRPRDQFAFLTL